MARLPKRGRTHWQKSWGSKRGVSPRRWTALHWRLAGATGGGLRGMEETDASQGCSICGRLSASQKSEEETYAVLQSTIGPGVDDSELVIPGGHVSLGCRSRDRPFTPKSCRQGLGDEWRQPDQSALFDAEADRYLQRQEPQGCLDDPPERLWARRQVLARGHATRQGWRHVRDHGQRRRLCGERQ